MFLKNFELSETDRVRAKDAKVVIFGERDLEYYERLQHHVGSAAKYQFLAECMPGKPIRGLEIVVPAVRTRMGGHDCYTFSIAPEYLLKIAFVSHRGKGKASDVHTYQRMLNRGRLARIKEYIEDDGIFPTNIVINLEKGRATWDRSVQEENSTDLDVGILGWLHIRPAYKSAWIIDGQHRLYAYSGLEQAKSGKVAVLAFEGLPESQQAQLFIDINAKQKRVPQSLLQELFADLRWEADKVEERISAIISRAIQELDVDSGSPFYQRIQTSEDPKSLTRCISINSIFSSLEPAKEAFYIVTRKHDEVLEYGPLWTGSNEASTTRTACVLNGWFSFLSQQVSEWWAQGKGESGGLAMNDPVIAFIKVLRSVFSHLQKGKLRLVSLSDSELVDLIMPYGVAVGKYLASLGEEQRKSFRDKRGIQGQTWRRRQCEKAIRGAFQEFNPDGLDEYIENEKKQTTQKGREAIDQIEEMLQKAIIAELKRDCGPAEHEWWALGVPQKVRVRVSEQQELENHKRGGKENYFNLIDYRYIAAQNWNLFERLLGHGKGSKEKRLAWLDYVNEKRNLIMHASSGVVLPAEDMEKLQELAQWLRSQLHAPLAPGPNTDDETNAVSDS
jgi:DGQHR domain-containing protein